MSGSSCRVRFTLRGNGSWFSLRYWVRSTTGRSKYSAHNLTVVVHGIDIERLAYRRARAIVTCV